MTAWSVYETANGRLIGRTFSASSLPAAVPALVDINGNVVREAIDPAADFLAAHLRAGESGIVGDLDHQVKRIVAGAAVDRATCPVSASLLGLVVTLSGVPLGATINVRGTASTDVVNDDVSGAVELTMPSVGNYRIAIDCWPARDFDQEFTL